MEKNEHNKLHGLYHQSMPNRQKLIAQARQLDITNYHLMQKQANPISNHLIENYITDYYLPEGLLTNLVVNGKSYCLPMVTEEPSVVAAANNGAQRVAKSGGFTSPKINERRLIGQVVLDDSPNPSAMVTWLKNAKTTILAIANAAHPSMSKRGGGAKDIRIRQVDSFIILELLVDVVDAMGANSVNTMAEAVAHWLQSQNYSVLTAILSNLATNSLQTVSCSLQMSDLATKKIKGAIIAKRIVTLSRLAQIDPYRAATHNKGIMNGIDAVIIASGNDWRAIEAGAHAYAARNGAYRGLATWKINNNKLVGSLTLPLPVGIVGGSIKLTTQSRLNYQLSGITTAQELAQVTAATGLAQNLAALRALVSTGIQTGHMQLQYRSLAIAVGAHDDEVNLLAAQLAKLNNVDRERAWQILTQMRKNKTN